ncbi:MULTISPECIES: nitrous oxide reductase family maturation protein NosD [Halomonas]|uniref:nitrous oxide reductase family maturation protein NosD n=1 Tax=Halomonas TaxID=2745 RepID=UPI001C956254|nr:MULTISPECIES: nitrous oxide reductase family maturation protein NosD [Halomonas]MBY6206109.1 nitrous oxide reductase family maturation protein NosD [Halomonas sp. DP3Y7-2]MBY6228000.1 nitrous oxide reductase family maturation protein NosD [Halomonas sp. DP3Y7-1]MCA0916067.1 nitrous oxide reductase family maturation protein NosD [Halomonas denitrificans]
MILPSCSFSFCRSTVAGLVLALLCGLTTSSSLAATLQVTPEVALQRWIDQAAPGDTLMLTPGHYRGPVVIDKPLTLNATDEAATLDGNGSGTALTLSAPHIRITGLTITRWGDDLTAMDAGVHVEKNAQGAIIARCRLEGPGFGIWLDGVEDAQVLDNRIRGDIRLRSQDRGNGVHLFNVRRARVAGNDIRQVRDGVYIDTSSDSVIADNRLEDLRYGVHYMYAHDNTVTNNLTRHTRTGYALMQSRGLTVTGNRSVEDRNYGILMNNITESRVIDNDIFQVRQPRDANDQEQVSGGDGKAIFVYNAQFNEIRGNRLQDSDIGLHLTAGSEDNLISGNAFIHNRRQVKYVATRQQEWSEHGGGNYWSDYLGWDLDENGVGDAAYQPNDAMDLLLWRHPQARVLMMSPTVLALRWVQRALPVFRPPGITDSAPLMSPPRPPLADRRPSSS